MLDQRCAVIYGGSGAIGSAVASVFAREGAAVYLAARSRERLEDAAKTIRAIGGKVEVATVDVLDPQAVADHAKLVASRANGIDVMLNAVSFMHDQGKTIDDLSVEEFMLPVDRFIRAMFNTAKGVVPHLNREAVILALSTPAAKMTVPGHLGYSSACAAIEAFSRCLAQELGSRGARVVCLRPHAISDAPASYTGELFARKASSAGLDISQWLEAGAQGTMLQRLPMLADVAETAAFLASTKARALTAAVANLTCGQVPD
jgi:3-oxoacyl-[acyl-carrier protein] reductase